MVDGIIYKECFTGFGAEKTIFNKKQKGWVIVYDTRSLPDGMKIKDCEDKEKGEIYWGSSFGGIKPEIINLGGDKFEDRQHYKIVDLAEFKTDNLNE